METLDATRRGRPRDDLGYLIGLGDHFLKLCGEKRRAPTIKECLKETGIHMELNSVLKAVTRYRKNQRDPDNELDGLLISLASELVPQAVALARIRRT
jgi:hypothetical protein